MRFRPSPWLTLAALLVLAALLGLGTWQLQRLAWKDELNAVRTVRLAAPPQALSPAEIAARGADPGLDLQPVVVTGHFDHGREFLLHSRVRDGRVGRGLLTPLVDASGTAILVDRGWLPPPGPAVTWSRPEGPQRAAGWLRLPPAPGPFAAANDAARGQWLHVDASAMGAAADLKLAALYLIVAPAAAPDGLPVARAPDAVLPSPHLGYALTWFGLAAALVGVWASTGIVRSRQRESDT
ncbi:MAG: SURF1 family protein [Alphaproteobacteria bacterium]|nr:SURF1 family protein [Alphaproteobacteria bacterium]